MMPFLKERRKMLLNLMHKWTARKTKKKKRRKKRRSLLEQLRKKLRKGKSKKLMTISYTNLMDRVLTLETTNLLLWLPTKEEVPMEVITWAGYIKQEIFGCVLMMILLQHVKQMILWL
jgi:hypothetical protein|tara:strand:+ start:425 stop:778 length:354 start_codon:yes stop_codon:yes gene_type:complete